MEVEEFKVENVVAQQQHRDYLLREIFVEMLVQILENTEFNIVEEAWLQRNMNLFPHWLHTATICGAQLF